MHLATLGFLVGEFLQFADEAITVIGVDAIHPFVHKLLDAKLGESADVLHVEVISIHEALNCRLKLGLVDFTNHSFAFVLGSK